jgi:putative ABC transport system permease protein
VVLGALVTAGYATQKHWQIVVPLSGVAGGVGVALALGAIAGLYPAVRAARLAPTDALRTT